VIPKAKDKVCDGNSNIPTTKESLNFYITNENNAHQQGYCSLLIHSTRPFNQAYDVEMLKWLHEAVCRKRPELWPDHWILHHDNAPAHKVFSIKQCLAKKSFREIDHPPYSPDLAPNGFWLFPKMKCALKGPRFQHTEDI
jgi:histone-lysine N-methyltransferase SETMAR